MVSKYKLLLKKARKKIIKKIFLNLFLKLAFILLNLTLLFLIFELAGINFGTAFLLIIISLALAAFAFVFIHKCNSIDLKLIAELCDNELISFNQIATGFELINNNDKSRFAIYAAQRGLEILENHKDYNLKFKTTKIHPRWYLFVIVALVIILFLSIAIESKPAKPKIKFPNYIFSFQNVLKLKKNKVTHTLRKKENILKESLTFSKHYSSSAKTALGTNNELSQQHSSDNSAIKPGFQNTRKNQSKLKQSTQNFKKALRKSENTIKNSNKKPSPNNSKGINNDGQQGLEGESEKSLSIPQNGLSGNDMLESNKRQSSKKSKKKKTNSRGGLSPLSPDQKYDKGTGKEDNDHKEKRPSDGRGDSAGEKKTRGTASMLSAIPQPDLVNGSLSPGKSISHLKQSIPVRKDVNKTSTMFNSRKIPEKAVDNDKINPALEQAIKKYIINLHNKKVKKWTTTQSMK